LEEFPLLSKGFLALSKRHTQHQKSYELTGICKKPSNGLGFIKQDLNKPNCSLVSDLT
jgi:hypothetical protein